MSGRYREPLQQIVVPPHSAARQPWAFPKSSASAKAGEGPPCGEGRPAARPYCRRPEPSRSGRERRLLPACAYRGSLRPRRLPKPVHSKVEPGVSVQRRGGAQRDLGRGMQWAAAPSPGLFAPPELIAIDGKSQDHQTDAQCRQATDGSARGGRARGLLVSMSHQNPPSAG